MKVVNRLVIFHFVILFGCNNSQHHDFYLSDDFLSGIRIYNDSIYVTSPYGIMKTDFANSTMPNRFELDNANYQVNIELDVDSAIVAVGSDIYVTYPIDYSEVKWDSILVKQVSLGDRKMLLSKMVIHRDLSVNITGMWNKKQTRCTASKMILRRDTFADELFNELNRISPLTFKLVTYDESDGISFISLMKCKGGNCVSFKGEYVSANFQYFQYFLNRPFRYIICGK